MPLCRECYNFESKKQMEAQQNTILDSNSQSVSTENGDQNNNAEGFLLNMEEFHDSAKNNSPAQMEAESPDPTIRQQSDCASPEDQRLKKLNYIEGSNELKTQVKKLECERQNSDLLVKFQECEGEEGLRQKP